MKNTSFLCLLLSLLSFSGGAAEVSSPIVHTQARIAIIIDDIGDNLINGLRIVHLPGAVTCSFLPYTPYARQLAIAAHRRHKDVMLHLPMESEDSQEDPGPGALTLNMTQEEFTRTFQADLAAIPFASGVNNHMGSLITRHPGHMTWLMREINRRGDLFFVDSRTTEATVAQRVAQETGVPNLHRDVFLDNDLHPDAIAAQFAQLIAQAKRRGSAVAIGHPHPATLRFLEEKLPNLGEEGIQLVSVSQLIDSKQRPQIIYAAKPLVLGAMKAIEPSPVPAVVTP